MGQFEFCRIDYAMLVKNGRFTRLTNAFSKKVANLEHSVSLTFMHYNFCRIHQTLRVTPAMAAGLTDHVWELSDLIALMPKPVARPWGSVRRAEAMAEAPLAKTSVDADDDNAARRP